MLRNRSWWCVILVCILATPVLSQTGSVADLDPESTIKVGKIYVTGNSKTRLEIILRELDFSEGDELKLAEFAETLTLDQQKLTNTRLFVSVEIVPLFMSNTDVDVLIRVQERWYIFPLPIFKLADRNFTEWWVNQNRDFGRVNYGAQLVHTNLTGRNDRFRVRAQFGFAKQFSASYQVPYINAEQTIGIGFSTSYTTNKTVGVNSISHRAQFVESDNVIRRAFNTSGTITLRPSFYTRHSLNIGYSRSSVSDTIRDLNPEYHLRNESIQDYIRLSYTFSLDKRDYIAYPLTGSLLTVQLNQFGVGKKNDFNMLTTRLTFAKFFDLGGKFYFANRIDGYNNSAQNIPYIVRSGFGYRPDFIRGYERFVIESNQYISNRSSLRFKVIEGVQELNRRSLINQFRTLPYAVYLKAFMDAGYTGRPIGSTRNNFFNNEWIGSVGLGLDIVTYYDFVVRLEYSINREGDSGFFFNFKSAL